MYTYIYILPRMVAGSQRYGFRMKVTRNTHEREAISTDQYAQMHTKYSQPTQNKYFNSEQTLQKKNAQKMGGAIQVGEDS